MIDDMPPFFQLLFWVAVISYFGLVASVLLAKSFFQAQAWWYSFVAWRFRRAAKRAEKRLAVHQLRADAIISGRNDV